MTWSLQGMQPCEGGRSVGAHNARARVAQDAAPLVPLAEQRQYVLAVTPLPPLRVTLLV